MMTATKTVVVAVAVVGMVTSIAIAAAFAVDQRRSAAVQLDRRVSLVTEAVAAQTRRYVDTVDTVAAAVGVVPTLTAEAFHQAVAPVRRMGLAGVSSIAFLVPATDEQVGDAQTRWRSRGVPDLLLRPYGTGRDHFFTVFAQPLDGSTPSDSGIDASQAAPPSEALRTARSTGRTAMSDPYELIVDRDLPPDRRQLSFVLAAPVYHTAAPGGLFLGWVLMGLRGQDFIGATLRTIAQNLVDVTLTAPDPEGRPVAVTTLNATGRADRDLHREARLAVADRQWTLRIDGAGATLPGATTGLPTTVALGGTLLSLLLAGLVHMLGTGRARAQAEVATATAELRGAEAESRRQADLLHAVLDNIGDGVGVVDERGEFLLHNPAAKRILGIDEDRGGPEHWSTHYGIYTVDGNEPFPTAELPLVRALAGEPTEHVPMLIRNATYPDGVIISVSARPLSIAGGPAGAVAVFHDITERTRADRALAKTTTELRAARDTVARQGAYLTQVLDAIDVAVLTCDASGTIVHANRAARAGLAEPAEASTVADYVVAVALAQPDGTPMPLANVPLLQSLQGRIVEGEEAELTRPDGRRRFVLVHSQPLRNPEGLIIGAAASTYDVTAVREREAELAAFAGIVAHDLKSPLTAVHGFTEVVRAQLTDLGGSDAQVGLLDRVLGSTNRMRQLIDDLLSLATARNAAISLDIIDLTALVDDVVHDRLGATVVAPNTPPPQIHVEPLPPAIGDQAMIRQLLDNLIGNAIKYTPPGRPARVEITARPVTDHHIQVTVADRGIGIPAGQHRAIFGGFHRAHTDAGYAGTGLGLAICERIVDRHSGTIFATDNPGGGTRIHFTLPAASPDQTAQLSDVAGHA